MAWAWPSVASVACCVRLAFRSIVPEVFLIVSRPSNMTALRKSRLVVGKGLRAQRLPVRAGRETMLGKTVPALARIDAISGKVSVEGEYWNAVSDAPVEPGQRVEIIAIDGLTLKVKPKLT